LRFLFRYENIEYQIVDKYIRNKPRVNNKRLYQFEYSDEISDFGVFKRLNEACEQAPFGDFKVQMEIMDEFGKINELSEALNVLKVVINYAISTSTPGHVTLADFLDRIFANDEAYLRSTLAALKSRIVQATKLQHLKHIWITLMMKRALILFTLSDQVGIDLI
jgi:hypothetical protein